MKKTSNILPASLKAFISGDVLTSEEKEVSEERNYSHHEKTFTERRDEVIVEHGKAAFEKLYSAIAVVLAVIIIGFLLITVSKMPEFGNPKNPANNEVVKKYLEDGIEDTGAVNLVAGMILDYRAFDTFGESTVLFVAAGAVIILLRNDKKKLNKTSKAPLLSSKNDPILRRAAILLVPAVIIYGIYVVMNGHLSPGGGFSGGAIMGAGLILYTNAFGFKAVNRFFTYKRFNTITVSALGVYAASKSYSFYTGANHLHSIIPKGVPGDLISSGLILVLNICVGVIVCCTMFGFYSLFMKESV